MNPEHTPRRDIQSLSRLNELAHKNAWTLDDLDWSMPIDRDRLWAPTSMTPLSYLPSYGRLNETQLIGMTPNIRIDWKADSFTDAVSLPVGLGTIGMFTVGRMPVRWGVELQYYVMQPSDIAPKFNFKVFFAPIILNPFK